MIHDYENCEVENIKRHVNSEVPKYVNIVNSFISKKILELYWNHQRDAIREMLSERCYQRDAISEINKEAVNIITTKQKTLSIIASVYEPEKNNVLEVMKEGTCRRKQKAAELTNFRMRCAPGTNCRGGSVKYSYNYLT